MIKQILVPTDGSTFGSTGVAYCVALAKRHGASLIGLHVIDIKLLEGPFLRDISASLGTAPYVNYQNNISLLLEERGKAALEAFSERCREAEIPFESHQVVGAVSRVIVEESGLADLLVMGRGGEHGEWFDGLLGSTTEAVARHAQCPVLLTEREEARIQRVVVAYDGSEHAQGALQFATSIGEAWGVSFEVLMVGKDGCEEMADEARSYLEAHRMEVQYVTREGDPRDVILDFGKEHETDLIVMGAYGHSRVRELILGSTTQYVINHAPCPVLLAR